MFWLLEFSTLLLLFISRLPVKHLTIIVYKSLLVAIKSVTLVFL